MNWLLAAVIYVLVVALTGLIPATLARTKGRSFFAWWGISLLVSGAFALIPLAMLPTLRCQQCNRVVSPGAATCPYCAASLDAARHRLGAEAPTFGAWAIYWVSAVLAILGLLVVGESAFGALPDAAALTLLLAVVAVYQVTFATISPPFFARELRTKGDSRGRLPAGRDSARAG